MTSTPLSGRFPHPELSPPYVDKFRRRLVHAAEPVRQITDSKVYHFFELTDWAPGWGFLSHLKRQFREEKSHPHLREERLNLTEEACLFAFEAYQLISISAIGFGIYTGIKYMTN